MHHRTDQQNPREVTHGQRLSTRAAASVVTGAGGAHQNMSEGDTTQIQNVIWGFEVVGEMAIGASRSESRALLAKSQKDTSSPLVPATPKAQGYIEQAGQRVPSRMGTKLQF